MRPNIEIFNQLNDDWRYLSEKLQIGDASEVDTWALKWRSGTNADPWFAIHHGALKMFSWFIVDRRGAKLKDRAFAKGEVFDVLERTLPLDVEKCLRRDACASVDWARLHGEIDAQLKKFELPNQ